ncbi:hypothetical protein [Rhizobium sp. MHM7A]|uniref:hypothetical protein n=1 Tax=Rhizobium sp. MHM7A TaxID=2583233 RepID=UPI001105AF6A|nr:hypothetical protein [Rhizobium sp. MHM7A]TLX16370.1 hypothetical protein FFR93_03290 [Rhizobium sp. MHM7A]
MSKPGFVEIALVHTHFFVANKRIPDYTISSYRNVFASESGSFFYEDGDSQVTISHVEPDTRGQEPVYEQHVRLPVSPEYAVELALDATRKELSDATDAMIVEAMTRRFAPPVFKAFLEENGWKDMEVGRHDGLYVFAHPDYPPRQIIYACTTDPELANYVSEDIHDMVRKYAEITKRPELGVRLDLIRRATVYG